MSPDVKMEKRVFVTFVLIKYTLHGLPISNSGEPARRRLCYIMEFSDDAYRRRDTGFVSAGADASVSTPDPPVLTTPTPRRLPAIPTSLTSTAPPAARSRAYMSSDDLRRGIEDIERKINELSTRKVPTSDAGRESKFFQPEFQKFMDQSESSPFCQGLQGSTGAQPAQQPVEGMLGLSVDRPIAAKTGQEPVALLSSGVTVAPAVSSSKGRLIGRLHTPARP